MFLSKKKSRIRETKHLSTDADSCTDAIGGWTKAKSAKKTLFLRGDFRPLPNKNIQMLDQFFPLLFPKDFESLKILDIRLWEVGAKRPLNGTSKVNKHTDRRTYRQTDILTYRKLWKKHTLTLSLPYLYQTLSIWLGIQFRQRYSQIKDWRPSTFLNIFGLAWPWDPRGPGTYSRFVQSPLMIDLWMEECPILMIFSYFWRKWRWSPSQY